MNKRIAAIFLILSLPAFADVIYLKGGQKIEGEIRLVEGAYEVKTEFVTLTIPKEDADRVVRNIEALTLDAETLHKKARALYDEALTLEKDPKTANARLKEGVEPVEEAPKPPEAAPPPVPGLCSMASSVLWGCQTACVRSSSA